MRRKKKLVLLIDAAEYIFFSCLGYYGIYVQVNWIQLFVQNRKKCAFCIKSGHLTMSVNSNNHATQKSD